MNRTNLCILFLSLLFMNSCQEQDKSNTISAILLANGEVPNLAADSKGIIHLAFGQGDSILYSISTDKGESFSTPELVDTFPDLFSFAMRGPQVVAVKGGACILACNKAGDIFSYKKQGSGKWQRTVRVNDVDTIAKEGFVAVDSDGENKLFAAWLDLRDDNKNNMYGARSDDGGQTWSKNLLVYHSPDGHTCECCKPSVLLRQNKVYVMFRNWLSGNRDLYLASSSNAGNSFEPAKKLGEGSWRLNGCPMDGGSLVMDKQGIVQTVFRRGTTIYAAQPGGSEKKIGEGKNCTMETAGGRNIYAWIENGEIVIVTPTAGKVIPGKGKSPALKALDDNHILCVWENEKKIYKAVVEL